MNGPACQVCGAPMKQFNEANQYGTATRFECKQWLVHPLVYFGAWKKRPEPNAPAMGVPR